MPVIKATDGNFYEIAENSALKAEVVQSRIDFHIQQAILFQAILNEMSGASDATDDSVSPPDAPEPAQSKRIEVVSADDEPKTDAVSSQTFVG